MFVCAGICMYHISEQSVNACLTMTHVQGVCLSNVKYKAHLLCVVYFLSSGQGFIRIIAVQVCGQLHTKQLFQCVCIVRRACADPHMSSHKSLLKTRISHYCLQAQLDRGRAWFSERHSTSAMIARR